MLGPYLLAATWPIVGLAAAGVVLAAQVVYLKAVLAWCHAQTEGVCYYGRSRKGRRRFKKTLGYHRFAVAPILRLSSRHGFDFAKASFLYEGLAAPKGSCNPDAFEQATHYVPRSDDLFVASPMKCGTTWLQYVALQVLERGREDLAARGTALDAVSPWLESSKSVSVEDAPSIGRQRPRRVVKTHLPASLCPYSCEAKYVYVVRHPVSCFASCVDFLRSNLGRFAPTLTQCEEWFCSDQMWWGPWPEHVAGWRRWSRERDNVLLVSFEEMKRDLPAVVDCLADFLELDPLTAGERASILAHSSFQHMRDNYDCFEMNPPHLLQPDGNFFVSGQADRHRGVAPQISDRIVHWSTEKLSRQGISVEELFPGP